MLVAFDSNILTSFLNANSRLIPSVGDELASFRLFMYAPKLTILPTVTKEAERIPKDNKREEHLRWVWYHFPEDQLDHESAKIEARTQDLVVHHLEEDHDDCRIVAEAEKANAGVLATIDKKIKRLQKYTAVRLLTPADALEHLGILSGAPPYREPASGHPLYGAAWWRI